MGTGVVAVLGASGFVGQHLVRDLAAAGFEVRAVSRRRVSSEVEAGVTWYGYTDVEDRIGLRRALEGADTVVDAAGRAHKFDKGRAGALTEYHRVNVIGLRIAVEEALKANVTRLVALSSVGAVGQVSGGRVAGATGTEPTTDYGKSKRDAERLVMQLAAGTGMKAVLLRPPMVYGPGMRGNPLRIFRLVSSGVPLPFAGLENRRSRLYVGNLTAAVCDILTVMPEGGPYFIRDTEELSTREFVLAIGKALGVMPRLFPVPTFMLTALASVGDVVSRFAQAPLTSDSLDGLVGQLLVDDQPLRAVTGYSPPVTLTEGLARSAEWFRSMQLSSCARRVDT